MTVAITQQPSNITVTAGDNAAFTVVATGTDPLVYEWYETTAGLIVGEVNSSLIVPTVSENDDGKSYYVIVADVVINC